MPLVVLDDRIQQSGSEQPSHLGPSSRVTPDTANDYVPLLVSAAERLAKDLAADGLGRR